MKHPCDLVRCGCVKNFLLNHPGWCKPENSHVTKKLPKKGCYRTLVLHHRYQNHSNQCLYHHGSLSPLYA